MTQQTKTTLTAAAYSAGAIACGGAMYVAYQKLGKDPSLFSLITSVLGIVCGFLIAKASSVHTEARIGQILGAALIREKEAEAKTVDELKATYQAELKNLKEVIEREGNQLLLSRLRELSVQDVQLTIREIESLDDQLKKLKATPVTPEVSEIRTRLGGMLSSVRNPEQDDRIIRQLFYSLPVFGNLFYLLYALLNKIDPTLEERMHRRLNQLTTRPSEMGILARFVALIVLIGLIAVGVYAIWYALKGYRYY